MFGLIALGFAPVAAQDLLDPHPLAGVVDELRIGIHAYNVHYAMLPTYIHEWQFNEVSSISFDVLFTSPQIDAFTWIGSPRPEIGATLNLAGKENLVHAGLTWQLPIFDTPVFLEGTFGAAIHDGALSGAPEGQKNFGCRVNFYERFGIGVNASDTMTATLAYEHTSNNNWCGDNAGLSNFGLRVGWKF
ncbi:acyloxyacyl hydrolase [Devosia sediminis]|uniref:Acyloxyacyl hydrolase n=1 Tax=Devosia sediminis TaxID=2798801 RepID=A0A934ITF7_9HYPH|nr:acyloxyacyl hydrolase [Devosia sediminis]MBJ3786458.1 acyloxyacyl hydrolase [Devosia sediminis]